MARIPLLTAADANDENKDVLARDINLYYAMGHAPGAARGFSNMGLWLRFDSGLDGRIRELAILQVGYVERAAYEWAHHVEIGYDFGVTDEDIRRLIAESEGQVTDLTDLERNVLRAAREIARDGAASDAALEALAAEFDNGQLVELTAAVAFYCAIVRVLKTLKVDLEPEAQKFLDKWPLPND